MNTLDRYVLKQIIPVFLVTLAGLSVILSVAELFTYMHLIVDRHIPLADTLMLFLLYVPQALVHAIPVSMLFSVCFIMASLFANNELIAILNSGVSFMRLTRNIIILAFGISAASLLFQDLVQIPASFERSQRIDHLVGRPTIQQDSNIVLWNQTGSILYFAQRFREDRHELRNLTVLFFREHGGIQLRVDAPRAVYHRESQQWVLEQVRIYEGDTIETQSEYRNPALNEPPDHFRRRTNQIEHMTLEEGFSYIRRMGYIDTQIQREAQTDLYERIIFSFTPLLVVLLSVSAGSRFRKNILLLSLFFSLSISVLYYIYEFIFLILARQGYLHPLLGSLLPFGTFFILSMILFRQAKT